MTEAHVLHHVACLRQIVRVIPPFLGGTNLCYSKAVLHKAMLAGERSSWALRRWSRLDERCTQAQRPRPAGAALCLFPRPACAIWCLVCLWWCVGNASRREL